MQMKNGHHVFTVLYSFVLFLSCFIVSLELANSELFHNDLALTPPMGWNSWNHFHCQIDETVVKAAADALVSSGLAKLGYIYVNIDDCWGELNRDSKGDIVANKTTFPSGIRSLADYVHSKGLKLGIYADAGYQTCTGKMAGSLGHEERDANTFSSWGIDYLKYDNCYNDDTRPTIRYQVMSDALRRTGRPIFFSMCEWGDMHPALWGADVGNSWRTTDDISDSWTKMLHIADMNEVYASYAKPGGWNDPDMLQVGNGGMKFSEYVVHFSIWAVSKAPLLLGCDIRNTSNETMQIIGNQEVIAVNQDSLGIQATKVRLEGEPLTSYHQPRGFDSGGCAFELLTKWQIWAGPLSGKRVVILFVNRKPWKSTMTAHWDDIGFMSNNVTVKARDLWEHHTIAESFQAKLTANVDPHACKMFVLTPNP